MIHNAWQIDFNLSLPSFEPHLQGIRSLIEFASRARQQPGIFFISSIASVFDWPTGDKGQPAAIEEVLFPDAYYPQGTGYGKSECIAEQLLGKASIILPNAICRVGQIAGSVMSDKGTWNKDEWLPSLIASSKHLGYIPETLGSIGDNIDWIPIDILATAIVELALGHGDKRQISRVYHMVNPKTVTWSALVPAVKHYLGNKIDVVAYAQWLEVLRESAKESYAKQDFSSNPAIKLLDFFEGLRHDEKQPPRLETNVSESISGTLKGLDAVEAKDMERWMRQLGF